MSVYLSKFSSPENISRQQNQYSKYHFEKFSGVNSSDAFIMSDLFFFTVPQMGACVN